MDARNCIALLLAAATLTAGCAITSRDGAGFATVAASPNFRPLVERYGAAVVNVSVAASVAVPAEAAGAGEKADPGWAVQRGVPRNQTSRGGSGFIISRDGYVLSSCHVIEGSRDVTVRLADKREFKARVVGLDKASDVALLKIEGRDLPTVKLGSARAMRAGDWVVAIGSPYGFENSVTAGIVSATARALPDETLVPFLQTDVAVNPGNSGGPLFNAKGEVVGVNSQIFSLTGGFQGISFAVPIELVMKVSDALVREGRVMRGKLGVSFQELNHRLAVSFGLPAVSGALVVSVEIDGPADKAGLQSGDIVVKLGSQAVQRPAQLNALIAELQPGAKTALQVWRKGELKTVAAILAHDVAQEAGEAEPTTSATTTNVSSESGPERLGMVLRPLTPVEQRMIEASGGLLVGAVGGSAARAGIQPGDVILSVNGTSVRSAEQLRELFIGARSDHVALLVQRGDGKVFVPVER